MITRRQLNEINQLNVIFQNNECFRGAIGTDTGVRLRSNNGITSYINMVELYSYLYKHYNMINDVFKTDINGNIDIYLAHRVIGFIHNLMNVNQLTAAQALKELKRVRNCVDYNGELG